METPLDRPFVGREQELRSLRELHGRTGSQVAVVYGRRRVGKTALVRQAFAAEHKKLRPLKNYVSTLSEEH